MRLIEGNHKRDDPFNLENEEMVCKDCPVNYDKLQELYVEGVQSMKNKKPLPILR